MGTKRLTSNVLLKEVPTAACFLSRRRTLRLSIAAVKLSNALDLLQSQF